MTEEKTDDLAATVATAPEAEAPTTEPAAGEVQTAPTEAIAQAAEPTASAPKADEAGDDEGDDADLATDEEIAASAVEDAKSSDDDNDSDGDNESEGGNEEASESRRGKGRPALKRVGAEVRRLMDYATKYPEIGPTVAELSFKLGFRDVGDRVVRMGLESDDRNIEYFFVAAELARREGRSDDALKSVLDGIEANKASTDEPPNHRLLHLIRIGFAVLMFELNDVKSRPEFSKTVSEFLKSIESHFPEDPFFYTLLAQSLWLEDREGSEKAWDQAVSFGERETSWNARGTWYKEAEKHLGKAEDAYRRGLKDDPASALLMHNLAQVLMDRAAAPDAEGAKVQDWARQADRLMRRAIRATQQPRLRRHIRENIERVQKFRALLPADEEAEKAPELGDVVIGRVRSIQVYGAFLSIAGGYSGLLHKTELAHERIDNLNQVLKVGDSIEVKIIEVKSEDNGNLRIGFSRKAVLPAPPEGTEAPRQERPERKERPQNARPQGDRPQGDRGARPKRDDNRSKGGGGGGQRGNDRAPREYKDPMITNDDKFGKLGDILLAKLNLTKEDK